MAKRGSLGRNLSVLLGQSHIEEEHHSTQELIELPLTHLQPGKYQPRSEIEDTALAQLAQSIKKQGLLQPLIVRQLPMDSGRYEIIAGERRWRACQLAGLKQVPVIAHSVDDETAMAMALVENLQREDLNVMDEARAMQRLITEFDLTHQQVADLISKSRASVSNFLRLLQLHDDVKKMLEYGDLDMGHARCLLMLPSAQQIEAARLIIAKNLSVREAEALVSRIKTGKLNSITASDCSTLPPEVDQLLKNLASQLKTKVRLKPGKRGKGSLVIHYENEDSLTKVLKYFA